jgi:hypothetical protein
MLPECGYGSYCCTSGLNIVATFDPTLTLHTTVACVILLVALLISSIVWHEEHLTFHEKICAKIDHDELGPLAFVCSVAISADSIIYGKATG